VRPLLLRRLITAAARTVAAVAKYLARPKRLTAHSYVTQGSQDRCALEPYYCEEQHGFCTNMTIAPRECMVHDGFQRCWYTYRPAALAPGLPVPLVVNIHGFNWCADWMTYTSIFRKADAEGFIVALPQGVSGQAYPAAWNSGDCCAVRSWFGADPPDDVGFLRRMVGKVAVDHPIDTTRIYWMGHSNGCMQAQRMALEASDIVAAVGCHAGYLAQSLPVPASFSPTPVLEVQGQNDNFPTYSMAESNFGYWASLNACPHHSTTTSGDGSYNLHEYADCANGTAVTLVEVLGAWHWPYQCPRSETSGFACCNCEASVDTAQMAWDFVSRYSLATPPQLTEPGSTREALRDVAWSC